MIYISKLFSPISTGTSAGDIDVGATVKINENGSPVDYIVVQQGLPGSMYDASCDGTWLLRKDIAENRVWDSGNVNDYANSDINAYLNGDWLTRYDSDVAGQIVQCKIPYVNGSGDSPVASGASGLSVKAFLMSMYEVGFSSSIDQNVKPDGQSISFFDSGSSSSANNKRIAYSESGTAQNWWSRSPTKNRQDAPFRIDPNGWYGLLGASSTSGIRPCIILPFSFKFKEVS